MTGEELGFLSEALFSANALDVYFTAIQMKKNRPAYAVTVLTKYNEIENTTKVIFQHSSTIGLKIRQVYRIEMERKIVPTRTSLGTVRIKTCTWNNITKHSFEYEDLKILAEKHNSSISAIKIRLEKELN